MVVLPSALAALAAQFVLFIYRSVTPPLFQSGGVNLPNQTISWSDSLELMMCEWSDMYIVAVDPLPATVPLQGVGQSATDSGL